MGRRRGWQCSPTWQTGAACPNVFLLFMKKILSGLLFTGLIGVGRASMQIGLMTDPQGGWGPGGLGLLRALSDLSKGSI